MVGLLLFVAFITSQCPNLVYFPFRAASSTVAYDKAMDNQSMPPSRQVSTHQTSGPTSPPGAAPAPRPTSDYLSLRETNEQGRSLSTAVAPASPGVDARQRSTPALTQAPPPPPPGSSNKGTPLSASQASLVPPLVSSPRFSDEVLGFPDPGSTPQASPRTQQKRYDVTALGSAPPLPPDGEGTIQATAL